MVARVKFSPAQLLGFKRLDLLSERPHRMPTGVTKSRIIIRDPALGDTALKSRH